MWMFAWAVTISGPVAAQQCERLAEPLVMLEADVNAPTSLDSLDGPVPLNLVVFRHPRGGFVTASVDNLGDDDAPSDAPNTSRVFGQRFSPGFLAPDARYAFTIHDPAFDVADPEAPRRTIEFVAGDADDVDTPRIDEEQIAGTQTRVAGGWRTDGCGPLPYWGSDEHTLTVPLPEASDDQGVAAFELRVTTGGLETVMDLALASDGAAVLTALVFGDPPERVRVAALDHAGNASLPVDVTFPSDGGCAQSRPSHAGASLALLFALRAARSRRAFRTG